MNVSQGVTPLKIYEINGKCEKGVKGVFYFSYFSEFTVT